MSAVAGDQGETVGKRGGGNDQIVPPNQLTARLKIGPEAGVDPRYVERERNGVQLLKDRLDESLSAALPDGSLRAMDSMEKLRGGNCCQGRGFVTKGIP